MNFFSVVIILLTVYEKIISILLRNFHINGYITFSRKKQLPLECQKYGVTRYYFKII